MMSYNLLVMTRRTAPLGHTCPDINRLQSDLKDIQKTLKDTPEDEQIDTDTMVNEIENCIDTLEDLRNSNASLRDWGENLAGDLNTCDETVSELQDKVHELEEEIAKLTNRLLNLEKEDE